MTNSLALWLFGLILGFFLLDAFVLHWDTHYILMRKFIDLLTWLAFWR